jgi:hypothetical protein
MGLKEKTKKQTRLSAWKNCCPLATKQERSKQDTFIISVQLTLNPVEPLALPIPVEEYSAPGASATWEIQVLHTATTNNFHPRDIMPIAEKVTGGRES